MVRYADGCVQHCEGAGGRQDAPRRTAIVHGQERRRRPQTRLDLSGVSVIIKINALSLCKGAGANELARPHSDRRRTEYWFVE